jgi:predicted glycoside hydrolase/deacetylase ChbG (UPF0249 family)
MLARDLKICADDYGLTQAVSSGILEAVEAGRLDATGAMTTRPFWNIAARDLASLGSAVEVGLHLDLTLGPPLTRMPALAPNGKLPSIGALIRLSQAGRLPKAEIRAEIAAQIDAFGDHYGRAPAFVGAVLGFTGGRHASRCRHPRQSGIVTHFVGRKTGQSAGNA